MPENMLDTLKWARDQAPEAQTLFLPDPNSGDPDAVVVLVPTGTGGLELKLAETVTEPLRDTPRRRVGTAKMFDLASFAAHVARFKSPESAVFLNPDKAKPFMLAVIDYHDRVNVAAAEGEAAGEVAERVVLPRFGAHRTQYEFPLSDEWKAWIGQNNKPMAQREFAEFMEERIGDLLPAPVPGNPGDANAIAVAASLGGTFAAPARMMELSRGLKVHQNHMVKEKFNTATGETTLIFESENRDEAGGPMDVPSLFRIAIPIFFGDTAYPITVRLRYRTEGGKVRWTYVLYRDDVVFQHAIDQAAAYVRGRTDLPIFVGMPESRER